jgi:hexosaminidase
MQKSIVLSLVSLLLVFSVAAQKNTSTASQIHIIPKPVSLTTTAGSLEVKRGVMFHDTPKTGKATVDFLTDFFKTKNIAVKTSPKNPSITLKLIQDATLGNEGYKLSVSKAGITLSANTEAGLFYAAQTLIQATPVNGTKIPFVEITDYPRFGYRGLHLDVCRHMFPVEFIKKYIDLMARHKFNRFHWHLTDDQGWRIEIKSHPKLQEIAAYRSETVVGHAGHSNTYDGKRYGGFYTQQEVKEVIQYAAARHVTIIPEIEMPGHAQAAIAAYPELGCTGEHIETATTFGVFDPIFCAGKETTFAFLQEVVQEVMDLFPGTYIHIGGDEAPKTRWKACPHCQERIKTEGLKDEHELQSYFIQRMEKYINDKGKKIIGWDEILEGGLAPNATVMSWQGEAGGIAAAKLKHDVIMTPGNWCYFDHYQDTSKTEPMAIGGLTPVREVYSYEPLPQELDTSLHHYILGAQANLWTEYILTPQHAEYMMYPRASALAEVAWSPRDSRDYIDFLQRMETHLERLRLWNVNCAQHIRTEIDYIKNPQTKK